MFLENNNNNNNRIEDPIGTNGYKWEVGWWCLLIPSSLKLWVQICQGTTKHAPSPKKSLSQTNVDHGGYKSHNSLFAH
jgi:hypothetical protein